MITKSDDKHYNLNILYCGLVSGVLQAGVFNPWDRALFLSIKEDRPFLRRKNFEKPMTGLVQSLFQRTVSGGLYFPLEDIFRNLISEKFNESGVLGKFFAGTLAGGTNGILLNPASAIKVRIVLC